MEAESWECPFCGRPVTISYLNETETNHIFNHNNKYGESCVKVKSIVCPNTACKKFTIIISLHKVIEWTTGFGGSPQRQIKIPLLSQAIKFFQFIPPSNAKKYPNYVPKQIRSDYKEACLILKLSPKASATLSRRCLQGMIRDFWKVKDKPNLKQEIESIKDEVDPLMWEAINSIRDLGNVGAHMEQDVNQIIEIDSGEAEKLIWLIETLIKDWYINKHEREEKLKKLKSAKDSIKEKKEKHKKS